MWVEELELQNVRCFKKSTFRFCKGRGEPCRWVTLLGENGAGKSTALQALALLLAGPESAPQLLPRPIGWLQDESRPGVISTQIHQGKNDGGHFSAAKVIAARRLLEGITDPVHSVGLGTQGVFRYSFHLTGTKKLRIRNKEYTEPSVQPYAHRYLTWLAQNALISGGKGWFAAGYGAFRRLTREGRRSVPYLEPQARFANFATQFNEDEALAAFERWILHLDYRVAKSKGEDKEAKRLQETGVAAINKLLPNAAKFDSVDADGRIFFRVGNRRVPTVSLSDGYRSILALAGDLIWRLLQAFPGSRDPLNEEGVVLIDELDIHLHPVWQRKIAGWLREQFPNLQFIIATHSPLVAAGAGEDALTLLMTLSDGEVAVEPIPNVAAMNVDRLLQSDAFGLESPYSPKTKEKIDLFDKLNQKKKRTESEDRLFLALRAFMMRSQPIGGPPEPGSLDAKIEAFLQKKLK